MHFPQGWSILLCLLVSASTTAAAKPELDLVSSAPTARRSRDAENGIVRMPMRKRSPSQQKSKTSHAFPHAQRLPAQRAAEYSTSTTSSAPPAATMATANLTGMFKEMAYGIKMWIGEPAQAITLDFDTGSSETWVSPHCTMVGWNPAYEKLCRSLGMYLPQQSETVINVNKSFPSRYITYGSGETHIEFYKDTIRFSDPSMFYDDEMFALTQPVQFGVATWSSGMISGIFGAAYGEGYNQNYSGIIDAMYNQGLIRDKDFSFALGSVDDEAGEIVFGGVDMSKFSGPLHGIEMAKQFPQDEDGYYRYWINLTYVGVTQPGSCLSIPLTDHDFSERVLPDTGTTLTYVPNDVYEGIKRFFPEATENGTYGTIVDCSHLTARGSVDFGFGNQTIRVPYKDFIFELEPGVFGDNTETLCLLGVVPSWDEFYILGDTFLRSTYALFRQKEHKVYFGQYQNCGSNIISTHGIGEFHGDCEEGSDNTSSSDNTDSGEYSSTSESWVMTPTSTSSYTAAKCTSYSTGTYSAVSTSTSTYDSWDTTVTDIPWDTSTTDDSSWSWTTDDSWTWTTDTDTSLIFETITDDLTNTDWDWSTTPVSIETWPTASSEVETTDGWASDEWTSLDMVTWTDESNKVHVTSKPTLSPTPSWRRERKGRYNRSSPTDVGKIRPAMTVSAGPQETVVIDPGNGKEKVTIVDGVVQGQ
ncbi:aspartic peptidase domain-containing protein [Triangularia verruculosa]|uniref:Aspartic peptidase domain-containing protein n=1 Tax=Triangularia verruculosa TaxID=2587418 RepID=A0AAN6X7Z6_9PEZI|nr:aspartic peptidase domain-containing protein [Triangularia verruculosa]